ncbi:hypothetical protein ACHQM5_023253 [Ranunculus cassubicifolius]
MSKLNKEKRTHLKPLKIEDEKFVCVFYEQKIQEGTTIMYFHQAFAYDEECSRTKWYAHLVALQICSSFETFV